MSWQDQVLAVDPPTYEETTDYPPRVWWYNGVKQIGSPGIFYTKLEEHPGDALGKPWTLSKRPYDEVGYEAPGLHLAVIGARSEPFFAEKDAAGKETRRYIAQWVKGAKIYTEWLCFVNGMDYPVVLCSKGLTGKALAEASKEYRRRVLKPAEREIKRNLPPWSYWMPIATMTDDKGKVVFADTGHGSFVTPPALRLPDLADAALIEKLFVGPDILARGVEVRAEYETWLKEKRAGVDTGEVAAVASAVPAYESDEDPTSYDETPW
jgi:hypothetical protein